MVKKILTLDSARQEIQRLENVIVAKANDDAVNGNVKKLIASTPAIAKMMERAAGAGKMPEDLALPQITEQSLAEAIASETDYKRRWMLMRKLATIQTARAEQEVRARRRK